jgi:chromate transporter
MPEKAAAPNVAAPPSTNKVSLRELAKFFLRLGVTAFGGPAAHIAMMEGELVRRRQWLSREKFLDLLGASNLMPGPSSSELAIPIGYLLAGWAGLIVAGTCFILPAAMMVAALAWAYVHFGKLPEASAILFGVKPVVVAVILQALWGLGRTAVKTVLSGGGSWLTSGGVNTWEDLDDCCQGQEWVNAASRRYRGEARRRILGGSARRRESCRRARIRKFGFCPMQSS